MQKIKEWFAAIPPKQKKLLIYAMVAVAVIAVVSNFNNTKKPTPVAKENATIKAVEIDRDLLRKTELSESRRKIEEMTRQIEKLQNDQKDLLEKMKRGPAVQPATPPALPPGSPVQERQSTGSAPAGQLPEIPNASDVEAKGQFPPPQGGGLVAQRPPQGGSQAQQQSKKIGEIQVMSNPAKPEAKKTAERTVYLPPSFMSAVLLTGLDAGTSSNGKSNPDPVLLRVQTPAVLPNDVKANLAGCFVVGEGQGRLDKERVDIRLISLSCLTKEGSAVIDTPIKGFVTDADAKTGLAGHVVSKMGASVARTLVAGMLQGAGDMIRQESTTTTTSALGTVSTVDPAKIGAYALGSGLSAGSQRLADFYLALAKQATPVIEANANKHVTVVISEGKELVIKTLPRQDNLSKED